MNRRSLVTGLVVLAVFLAGGMTGAAVYRMTAGAVVDGDDTATATADGFDESGSRPEARPERPGDPGGPGGPGRPGRRGDPTFMFGQFLDEELDLTEEQLSEVEAILERREDQAREIFIESRNRFEQHLEDAVAEIESVLDEEQAQEFRELIESLEARFDQDDDPF